MATHTLMWGDANGDYELEVVEAFDDALSAFRFIKDLGYFGNWYFDGDCWSGDLLPSRLSGAADGSGSYSIHYEFD